MGTQQRGDSVGKGEARAPRVVAAFVRHGAYRQPADTPSARLPHPLTDAGRQHARDGAAELLAMARAHTLELAPVVDASQLLRAWETATLLVETVAAESARTFEVEEFAALNERSVGSAANLTLAQVAAVIDADPRHPPLPGGWKSNSTFRLPLPGAESLIEAGARVAAHVESRAARLAGRVKRDTLKIFVGHGGAFRHAAVALGLLELGDVPHLSMHHGRPLLFERQRDGTWQHLDGAWKLRATHPDHPKSTRSHQ